MTVVISPMLLDIIFDVLSVGLAKANIVQSRISRPNLIPLYGINRFKV